jgi:hypothetical protein
MCSTIHTFREAYGGSAIISESAQFTNPAFGTTPHSSSLISSQLCPIVHVCDTGCNYGGLYESRVTDVKLPTYHPLAKSWHPRATDLHDFVN